MNGNACAPVTYPALFVHCEMLVDAKEEVVSWSDEVAMLVRAVVPPGAKTRPYEKVFAPVPPEETGSAFVRVSAPRVAFVAYRFVVVAFPMSAVVIVVDAEFKF